MKRLTMVLAGVFLLLLAASPALANPGRGHGQGNYALFHTSLAAHGEWIETGFGTVWRPFHVRHAWRPYTKGRWIWTDYGWYWHSYEPFGWATYHYGRWIYDDYYGWIWVPDDVWGPAWVEWRYSDDYIGWSPLPPYAGFSISVGITFGRPWVAPVHYWSFVPCGSFGSVHVVNYIRPATEARRIYGHTREGGRVRTVDRRVVNDGVGLDRIERRSKEPIRRVELIDRGTPGDTRLETRNNRDRLEVYRPAPGELKRERAGQRSQEQVQRERDGRRSQEQVQRERAGQRSQEQVQRERAGRRSQEQVQRERAGQRSQEQVQRERDGRRTSEKELREKVRQRDRKTETGKSNPELRGRKPSVERPKPEAPRPKPDRRRGRDG